MTTAILGKLSMTIETDEREEVTSFDIDEGVMMMVRTIATTTNHRHSIMTTT
jgi:hypothetical protein